jgi:hypothetical protein
MRRLAFLLLLATGCKPDLGSPTSLITGLRILGVKTEPPEVTPGMPVQTDLLAVDPTGRLAPAAIWTLCLAHKSPAENNVVANDCSQAGQQLMPVNGSGPRITVDIPMNACALNGPDTPPTKMGEPPLRARDADITGGYYQPIGVTVGATRSFVLERISCNLPNVSLDVVKEYQLRYRPNQNPALAGLRVNGAEAAPVAEGMAPAIAVPAGATVTFEASWVPASRETFVVYDVARQAVVDHREELTVSWFATSGEFDRDRTGTTEADSASSMGNTWVAPMESGQAHLWIVLRDNRGGLDFREYFLRVGSGSVTDLSQNRLESVPESD